MNFVLKFRINFFGNLSTVNHKYVPQLCCTLHSPFNFNGYANTAPDMPAKLFKLKILRLAVVGAGQR